MTARILIRRVRSAIGRRLPARVQGYVEALKHRVPRAGPLGPADPNDRRVTILGYLTAPTGLGEGARLCAVALAELGFSVGLLDATPLRAVPGGVPLPERSPHLTVGDVGGTLLCHLNPPDLQITLTMLGLSGAGRRLVAYWAWELPVVPRAWRRAFRVVHEVWVPSAFVADALARAGLRCPIRVVAHPLRPPAPRLARPGRALALTVLTTFAYESGFDRKNPLAAIDAFRRAFGDRPDVRLIIKTRGASLSGAPERRLAERLGAATNIEVVDRDLSNDGMAELLAEADVLLSLHRAEGFGIPLAEAMLMGKPVVATEWSGNLEFMSHSSACLVTSTPTPARDETTAYAGLTAEWAEPSVEAAAAWLRKLEDPDLRRDVGEAARAHATQRLGMAAFADAIAPSFGGVPAPPPAGT